MALEINGPAILTALARSPVTFAMTESQVNGLALNFVLSRFKDKSVTLENIRAISTAIGAHDMALATDHLPTKDLATLVKRLDPKHPGLKTAGEDWNRTQILNLASGTIEPTSAAAKPVRAPKETKPVSKAPKTGEVMKSKALKPRPPAKKAPAKTA